MGTAFGYFKLGLALFAVVLTAITLVDGYVLTSFGHGFGRMWDNGVEGVQHALST